MYSLWQDLSVDTIFFDFVTLTLTFDLLLKKLNLGHNFWSERDRAFIFHMCISCGKTFLVTPKFLTSWPWPWILTYFWKNLTLTITFEPKVIGLSYYTCLFPVTKPFCWYQYFWPSDLDLDFDLLLEKSDLVAAGGISPVRTDPDLVAIVMSAMTSFILTNAIRPLTGGKCLRFAESLNNFVFIDISAFIAYFAFGFFVYYFVRIEWPYRTTVFILIAL